MSLRQKIQTSKIGNTIRDDASAWYMKTNTNSDDFPKLQNFFWQKQNYLS